MYVEIFIFILFLVIQIVIGLNSASVKRNIPRKYSNILGSMAEMGRTVETAVNKLDEFKVSVKVLKNLNSPALVKDGTLYVDKDYIFKSDLYSNYLAIYLLVNLYEGKLLSKVKDFIKVIYLTQLALFILGVILNSDLGFLLLEIAVGIEIFLISISLLAYFFSSSIFEHTHRLATEILKLDEVEEARSYQMNKELRLEIFEYSLMPIRTVVNFFKP